MCGIVGAIANQDIVPLLLDGLKRLEYRGYDSAGLAIFNQESANKIRRIRSVGKVESLRVLSEEADWNSQVGIAHTRWATHGIPAERNAHPHMSGDNIAIVHNGIIENHAELREQLISDGYVFASETDTEVIVHLLDKLYKQTPDLKHCVMQARQILVGAYGLAAIAANEPNLMIVTRSGSPLVIGLSEQGNYIASDVFALLTVTKNFIFLEEGDLAEVRGDAVEIFDVNNQNVQREVKTSTVKVDQADKGPYAHFMLKEIFEQPAVIAETLEGRIHNGRLLEQSFGHTTSALLDKTKAVQIVACGTSYHAGLVARYWLEDAGIPCQVEVASEYRYRRNSVADNSLLITISQSGETADTLAALRKAKEIGYIGSLCICNVPESSLVRESDVALMTRAGPEIGVASTKAFTTQLVALRLLTIALAKRHGMTPEQEQIEINALESLPRQVEVVLELADNIKQMASGFADKHNALFLGRGPFYPVALEGALKLKEISYIHAEAYPAGELKHGPLALVDDRIPVVCALPDDPLLEKVLSNLQEVRARGGQLFLFSDHKIKINLDHFENLTLADICPSTSAIVYSIPLQLLSYYVALMKGTDVDQPRNLAKSVTVE